MATEAPESPFAEFFEPAEGTHPDVDLPPAPEFDGSFSWLTPLSPLISAEWEGYVIHTKPEDLPGKLSLLAKELSRENSNRLASGEKNGAAALPDAFRTFFSQPELVRRVPSDSQCHFGLFPHELVRCPNNFADGNGGYLARFYTDGQGCYYWYLYMDLKGRHCILGHTFNVYADEPFSDEEDEADDGEGEEDEEAKDSHVSREDEGDEEGEEDGSARAAHSRATEKRDTSLADTNSNEDQPQEGSDVPKADQNQEDLFPLDSRFIDGFEYCSPDIERFVWEQWAGSTIALQGDLEAKPVKRRRFDEESLTSIDAGETTDEEGSQGSADGVESGSQ